MTQPLPLPNTTPDLIAVGENRHVCNLFVHFFSPAHQCCVTTMKAKKIREQVLKEIRR